MHTRLSSLFSWLPPGKQQSWDAPFVQILLCTLVASHPEACWRRNCIYLHHNRVKPLQDTEVTRRSAVHIPAWGAIHGAAHGLLSRASEREQNFLERRNQGQGDRAVLHQKGKVTASEPWQIALHYNRKMQFGLPHPTLCPERANGGQP